MTRSGCPLHGVKFDLKKKIFGICATIFYYFSIGKIYSFNKYEIKNAFDLLKHLLTNIKYPDVQA